MAQGAGTAAAAGGGGAGGEGAATCEVLPYALERVDWRERSELLQVRRYYILPTTYYLLRPTLSCCRCPSSHWSALSCRGARATSS